MESVVLGLLLLNIVITAVLLFRVETVRKSIHGIKVMYFTDISDVNGFIKKQKRIQVKAQLMIGEIPIGQPFVMSEQVTESVDEKVVKEIIDNIAKPLSGIGIKVITKGMIG